MSGPVRASDIAADEGAAAGPVVEVTAAREATVGVATVRRSLPTRARRTVGAWCFLDHAPAHAAGAGGGMRIGPHPHTSLQTVTWLLEGEVVHTDSLGSEQLIRPGQLNLMTAGHGVVHAEETPASFRGAIHAVQLWVAQPDATRHGHAAFEHHPELPRFIVDQAEVTLLVGVLAGHESPARRDTDHLGADLVLRAGRTTLAVAPDHEHAIVVLDGDVSVAGARVDADALVYLGSGRDELVLDAHTDARAILVGGAPFEARPFMWWNFVGRTRDEVDEAYDQWQAGDPRFGAVPGSELDVIPAPPPPWRSSPQPFRPR